MMTRKRNLRLVAPAPPWPRDPLASEELALAINRLAVLAEGVSLSQLLLLPGLVADLGRPRLDELPVRAAVLAALVKVGAAALRQLAALPDQAEQG